MSVTEQESDRDREDRKMNNRHRKDRKMRDRRLEEVKKTIAAES